MHPTTRVTQPGENQRLRISDLLERLGTIQQTHGDLWCYIYSTDMRANVPLLDYCILPSRTSLTFSAQTDTACEELYLDLIAEIERLKA